MKPKSTLLSFLFMAGSALLSISHSHGQTILADSYLTSLSVASPTTLSPSANFPSFLDGPLTGSSTLTIVGNYGTGTTVGQLSLVNNGASNTFNGNITVNGGTLRIVGSPFNSSGGFTAPSMGSSSTITLRTGGIMAIDDTVAGMLQNRFGSVGSRPAVNMSGGSMSLNGLNNATSSYDTFGPMTLASGLSGMSIIRTTNGTPTLEFGSFTKSTGAIINITGSTIGTGTNDVRIKFTSAPTLIGGGGAAGTVTRSLLVGAVTNPSPGVGDLMTYDTNGVRTLQSSEYNSIATSDINGAGTTDNVKLSGPAVNVIPALTADRTVNSLHFASGDASADKTWAMANKLTLTSGMFLRIGGNKPMSISSGTLTAGDGTNPIDLQIGVLQNALTFGGNSVIADNGSSVVSLVAWNGLALSSSSNNTYTGGTYVLGGTVTTGSTASVRYLGTGKVTVNNATLTLGNIGATSNSSGDDYTAINGGKIGIASGTAGAYTSGDTFNIAANSIIGGGSATGQGLASLTRGTNVTLASGAIVCHNAQTAALNTTTGTIQNLGSSADVYYGLNATQNSTSGSITIGNGTAFRGVSTDRASRDWQLGTINIASGTTSVDFQGHATHGAAAVLTLGNGTTTNNPVITFAGSGTVDINAIGSLTLNDDTAVYGNTGSSQNIRFVAKAGSTLTVTAATGMGSGSGIASALIQNGGILAVGNAASLNGAVTVQAGGQFNANLAGGLTGAGTLTFNEGSILNIVSQAAGFSGAQATGATLNPGTIVKLNVSSWGTAANPLDSVLGSGSKSVSFLHVGNNAVEPSASGTPVYTLNKSGGGIGGVLTNNASSQTVASTTNGNITLGANGGVMAATTGTTLTISEDVTGAGSLTIGTTDIIDGLPKLGSVSLSAANNHTGGTIVNAGTLIMSNSLAMGSVTAPLTVNSGGTFNMNNNGPLVGNLTGTGGVISGGSSGSRTLTVGTGNFGGGNFQGIITNGTGGTTSFTKNGSATITLSGANTYTGTTNINAGTLFINGNQSTASGNITVAGNATLGGTGTLGGNTTISANGKLEFNLSTAPGSHDKLELASSKTFAFSGSSTLTITTSGSPSPGLYTLITVPGTGSITGSAPTTVDLPVGWTADPPQIVADGPNTSFQINITSTGGGSNPEIAVDQGGNINSGGSKTFATATIGSSTSLTFTINNTGTSALNLTGSPDLVAVSGTNASEFTVTSAPSTPVAASGSTTFTVQFAPTGSGTRNAVLTIANNDSDEGSFTINVSGTGQTPYQAWSGGAAFDADTNGDGVKNGLAFLLGASGPGVSALSLLPTVSQSSGNLTMTFNMLNSTARGSASLNLMHSSDVGVSDPWTSVAVTNTSSGPTSGVTFTVTPGSPTNGVSATISSSEAAGGKLFGRLEASNP